MERSICVSACVLCCRLMLLPTFVVSIVSLVLQA